MMTQFLVMQNGDAPPQAVVAIKPPAKGAGAMKGRKQNLAPEVQAAVMDTKAPAKAEVAIKPAVKESGVKKREEQEQTDMQVAVMNAEAPPVTPVKPPAKETVVNQGQEDNSMQKMLEALVQFLYSFSEYAR
ncbi:hypothetical protein OESDEN_05546 [Oesophagostomum dentatum]|uniref:Uncharacterized protein n=1 Tax=Oesophagostomum dentatum TaxID=61180 RepID=A0A0B1TB85_OESDE|nr:hypothetical protein OESDEN_05546 [Oesophagostomum dentatum]